MNLKQTIKSLQKKLGVKEDGIVGHETAQAMLNKLDTCECANPDEVKELRYTIAAIILKLEDSRVTGPDSLRVTKLPSGDGGGTYEIAGICDGIEPDTFNYIHALLKADKRKEAWHACLDYVLLNTSKAEDWSNNAALQLALRDIIFNMGLAGCIKVIQRAIGTVKIDGIWGAKTQKAWELFTKQNTNEHILTRINEARNKRYADIVEANPVKAKFLKGWYNRTASIAETAKDFLNYTI